MKLLDGNFRLKTGWIAGHGLANAQGYFKPAPEGVEVSGVVFEYGFEILRFYLKQRSSSQL